MTVSKKIKTIDNKVVQKKPVYYYLDSQTAKSSALSSENVRKYDFF